MNVWAIVPVKPFRDSKSRLGHILSADQRAELTSTLLGRTLDILAGMPAIQRTLVISRDPAALKLARQHEAMTYEEAEKQDLNTALMRAAHITAAQKADCALILPADLPFLTAEDVTHVLEAATPEACNGGNGYLSRLRGVAICSDREGDGTNALLVCPPTGFTFQYGPGSFQRHLAEAERLGRGQCIVDTPGIRFDLDTEQDYEAYLARFEETLTHA
jgi:2-phospho-L-lactate guanylyltransferase